MPSRCRAKRCTTESGYYIFNEPLKQAAMEVKAKAAQEGASTEAARGGGTSTSISNNTSNGSGSSGSSSSSSIRGSDGKTRANGGGDVSNEGIPRN